MPDPSTTSKLRGLILSAVELTALTGLPSAFIEDYLTIIENTFLLSETIDSDIDNIDELTLAVEQNIEHLSMLDTQINKNRSDINKNESLILENIKSLESVKQELYILNAAVNLNRSNIQKNSIRLNDIEQLNYI